MQPRGSKKRKRSAFSMRYRGRPTAVASLRGGKYENRRDKGNEEGTHGSRLICDIKSAHCTNHRHIRTFARGKEFKRRITYAIRLGQHAENILPTTNRVLYPLRIQQSQIPAYPVRVREAFHLDNILRDGAEAEAAMPT